MTISDITSTAAKAVIYPSAGVKGPYKLTATPVGGGPSITVTCATPDCTISRLLPGTMYKLAAKGTGPTGSPTPASLPETVTTPGSGAPAIDVHATGPTTATVAVSPAPGSRGPFTVTATPRSGGDPITVTCPVATCAIAGLTPGSTYDMTTTSTRGNGSPTPASAPATVTIPEAGCVHGWEGSCGGLARSGSQVVS